MERYLRVNLLGPGPLLMKKVFTGPRSHKSWETLHYTILYAALVQYVFGTVSTPSSLNSATTVYFAVLLHWRCVGLIHRVRLRKESKRCIFFSPTLMILYRQYWEVHLACSKEHINPTWKVTSVEGKEVDRIILEWI